MAESQGTGDVSVRRCPSCPESDHGTSACHTVRPQIVYEWLIKQGSPGSIWTIERLPTEPSERSS